MPLVLCFVNVFYIWTVCCSFMWFDNCQCPCWNILLLVLLMAILPGFSYYRYVMEVSAVPWHVCLVSFHPPLLITGWCCVPPKSFSNLVLLFSQEMSFSVYRCYLFINWSNSFLLCWLYTCAISRTEAIFQAFSYFVFIRYVRLLGNVMDYFSSQRVKWKNVIWIKEEIKQLWQ